MENIEPHQPFNNNRVDEGKTAAIVAYITWVGLIIAFVMNIDKKNTFAAFHIRQSVGIWLTGTALGLIAYIPFLGWLVAMVGWLLVLVMWVMGLFNAIGGKQTPVPVLGEKYQEWFASIK